MYSETVRKNMPDTDMDCEQQEEGAAGGSSSRREGEGGEERVVRAWAGPLSLLPHT